MKKITITEKQYEKVVAETGDTYNYFHRHKGKQVEFPEKGTCGRCGEYGTLTKIGGGEIGCTDCLTEILQLN